MVVFENFNTNSQMIFCDYVCFSLIFHQQCSSIAEHRYHSMIYFVSTSTLHSQRGWVLDIQQIWRVMKENFRRKFSCIDPKLQNYEDNDDITNLSVAVFPHLVSPNHKFKLKFYWVININNVCSKLKKYIYFTARLIRP